MIDHKILVLGGYGTVGRVVCERLAERIPHRVIAAGRNLGQAEALAHKSGGRILPLALDPTVQALPESLWPELGTVVACIDLPGPAFAEECLGRGVNYLDISADIALVRQIEGLNSVAVYSGATGVLSVGLAPGLTNLMAARCRDALEVVDSCDIFIELGLGEKHGLGAIRWTVANMNREFRVLESGTERMVRPLVEGRDWPAPDGTTRRAYRFNFSDQHVLPNTLGIPTVSTWFRLDHSPTTESVAWAARCGLLRLAEYAWVKEALVRLLMMFQSGSDEFTLRVEARGVVEGKELMHECVLKGRSEGRTTGLVTAELAAAVHQGQKPSGVFHIEHLTRIEALLASGAFPDFEFVQRTHPVS